MWVLWAWGALSADPAAGAVAQLADPVSACSCDCCAVAPRLPSEQTATIKVKCAAPPPDMVTDSCPATCAASQADVVLTSSDGPVDYARFCQYKCKPSSMTVGTMCTRLDAVETRNSFEFDGNGNPNSAIYEASSSNNSTGWGDSATRNAQSRVEEQQAMESAQSMSADVHYDVEKVLESRLRAETASSMGRAAAAEARAKADVAAAERAALEARKAESVGALGAAGEAAAVEAEGAADEARREAQRAEGALRQVAALSQTVAQAAASEAKGEIRTQAAGAAKALAEAHAKMWGWDKPKFWPKVEAVRAADPYQAQMTTAVQRMGEYEGYAKGEMGKAQGDQTKAMGLATQANAMDAQGDKMGAETIRHEIGQLLSSSKGHQAKAQADWSTAETMRTSIPQWQDAAMKAATYASWKYSNVFTPPPPAFLQRT